MQTNKKDLSKIDETFTCVSSSSWTWTNDPMINPARAGLNQKS
jgi:hypothetical protein